MGDWRIEHGKEFKVPETVERALFALGFADASFHNDAAPRFERSVGPDFVLTLWVDHPDKKKRESASQARFGLEVSRDDVGDPFFQLAHSDEWAHVVPVIRMILKANDAA